MYQHVIYDMSSFCPQEETPQGFFEDHGLGWFGGCMRMAHGSQEERGEKINGFGHCTNIACFGLTLYYIFNLDPLPDLWIGVAVF